jgi:FAD/FMN-containing dehydrogenase
MLVASCLGSISPNGPFPPNALDRDVQPLLGPEEVGRGSAQNPRFLPDLFEAREGVTLTRKQTALREARKTIEFYGLDGAILGHVDDGNYHAVFPVDPNDESDLEIAEKVNAEIVGYALKRGGTCTGEHGIGSGKTEYLKRE